MLLVARSVRYRARMNWLGSTSPHRDADEMKDARERTHQIGRRRRARLGSCPRLFASALVVIGAAACAPEPARAPAQPPGYGAPAPGYPSYPAAPGQPPAQGPAYGAVPPPPVYQGPPVTGPSSPPPSVPPSSVPPPPTAGAPPAPVPPLPGTSSDPINRIDVVWLRAQASSILAELVAALPPGPQERVRNIPLVVDDTVGEVNAFAACERDRSIMAISDGLLEIQAWLSRTHANDTVFGTRTTDAYIAHIAKHQKPNQAIVKPPAELFPAATENDPRKLAVQHQIFQEQVAFVLGHELAHHHLGHLPCTAQPGPVIFDIARTASLIVPPLNIPNEMASDWEGTRNVLSAGARRPAGQVRWTEGGALLTMRFFAGMEHLSVLDIVFGFMRTHPPATTRTPVIQQSAHSFRTGGGGLSAPRLGG